MEPVYIVLEGSEGCGKSTHAKRLAADLDAVLTRETGGTKVGNRLRSILHDVAVTGLDDRAEALIAAADRAQHLAEVVAPTLAAGRHVVSDRSVYSTLAYQGYGRQQDLDQLRSLNDWAMRGRWPDLVLLLTVPAEVIRRRMAERDLDRFERSGEDFYKRVNAGFAAMAAADPQHWVQIDASAHKKTVTAEIRRSVTERLCI